MPTVNPSPLGVKIQLELASGLPAVGALLFFYVAGSVNTKSTTYTDSTGSTANANPLTLNSLGMTPTEVWLPAGLLFKIVYAPAGDTDPPSSPVWSIDNLAGVNDSSFFGAADQWVSSGLTPTFVSATSFTLAGDQTSAFHIGRRLKTTNSGGTVYSRISNSVFGALTTVTVVNDSGVLDAGLSAVSYGLLTSTNPTIPVVTGSFFVTGAITIGGSITSTGSIDIVSGGEIDVSSGTSHIYMPRDEGIFIGPSGSSISNSFNTVGVTLDQASADNEILSLKSSDVAHGVTAITDTDTYGAAKKISGPGGGLTIFGARESSGTLALNLVAYSGLPVTAATTTAEAFAMISGYETSGTGKANATANALVFGVQTQVGGADRSLFFVDEDGDLFVDGAATLTAFDAHNDALMCRAVDTVLEADGMIRSEFDEFVNYGRDDLVKAGIVTDPTDGGDPMLCITQLQRLHNGAIWQLYTKMLKQADEISELKTLLLTRKETP